MASRVPDHIALITETKSEAGTGYVYKGRVMVNMDRYPYCSNPLATFCIVKNGGGSGWIKIINLTTSLVLLEREITESSLTDFILDLSNFPQSGLGKFECQLKSDGTGDVECRCCSLEIM